VSAEFRAPSTTVHPRFPPNGQSRAARFRVVCLRVVDYAAAGIFAVIIFGLLFRGDVFLGVLWLPGTAWFARILLPAALAVAISFPVALRRRRPVAALMLVLAACAVLLAFGGAITRGPFLPVAFVLYLVTVTADRNAAIFGLAASLILLAVQGVSVHMNGVGPGDAVAAGLFLIIVWTVGVAVRQRRAYTARLRDQAASQIAAAAVTEERLRIARELHDVVAHSMTVVAVQAGFGEYVFDSQPAKARAALGAIQAVTRDALSDMQRLLGVLRQAETPASAATDHFQTPDGITVAPGSAAPAPAPDGEPAATRPLPGGDGTAPSVCAPPRGPAPLRPAPGLADLDRLVSATAGAGVHVEVTRAGRVRQIAPGTDLSAFRIVQEALTNVVKHSGADACRVSLGYGESDLSIEIVDAGRSRVGHATGNGHAAGAAHGPGTGPGSGARRAVPASPGPGAGHAIGGGPGPGAGHANEAGPEAGSGPPLGAQHAAAPHPEPGTGSVIGASPGPDAGHAHGAGPAPAASHVVRAGHGIIGMRERVSLCQGEFSAAPLPEGGFRVWARLPLTDSEP